MKSQSIYLVILLSLTSCSPFFWKLRYNGGDSEIIKTDAHDAFIYLNKIRQSPDEYLPKMGVYNYKVKKQPPLKWNSKLAKVAEIKAADMANRNYFNHVNPEGFGINYMLFTSGYRLKKYLRSHKSLNYFESLSAGVGTGKAIIDLLIIDDDVPSLGHRKHLLGIGKFNEELYDVGIGVAYNPDSKYKIYCAVVIAKHE